MTKGFRVFDVRKEAPKTVNEEPVKQLDRELMNVLSSLPSASQDLRQRFDSLYVDDRITRQPLEQPKY